MVVSQTQNLHVERTRESSLRVASMAIIAPFTQGSCHAGLLALQLPEGRLVFAQTFPPNYNTNA